ncbi:MAG: 2,3-diaminopropionate biosynthesis protein SbnA, partial [Cutibacterium acnes]|nr:2,3-diaminopropionate biosynthesis protein SbnA [Cutibacterium acnes]
PDLGERYLDGVYNDDWVMENFGESAFNYAIRPVAHEVKETEGI